jgi:hypothetical protein
MHLIALPKSYDLATIIGIARLRYRPHTQRTSEWLAKVADRSAELMKIWTQTFTQLEHAKGEAA